MKTLLHIQYTADSLYLWGESTEQSCADDTYPFAAPIETLIDLVTPLFHGWRKCPEWHPETVLLHLPIDHQSHPLPSRAFFSKTLISLPPISGLAPFYVPTLRCEGLLLLQLFQAVNHDLPGIGIDLVLTARLIRLAAVVVARGHILPSQTGWKPILSLEERTLLSHYSIPPSVTPTPNRDRPAIFATIVNALMRRTTSTILSRAYAARGVFPTAHDQWLALLRSESLAPFEPDADFSAQLEQWSAPVMQNPFDAPFTITLIPPQEEKGWHFAFSIGGDEQIVTSHHGLILLGQAVTLAPSLNNLEDLDTTIVQTFVHKEATILQAAGFAVSLPEGFTHAICQQVPMLLTNPDHFDPSVDIHVEWALEINGIAVTQVALQAIVDAGESLIEFHGHWIEVDLKQLSNMLASIIHEPACNKPLADIVRLSLASDRDWVTTPQIQAFLRTFKQGGLTLPDKQPSRLKATLRPYQLIGTAWLHHARRWSMGVCLADDMGLGKTIQTIAFLLSTPGPSLVVCPLSVLPVWVREVNRFAPSLKIHIHHGPQRLVNAYFEQAIREQHTDIVLTGYTQLHTDYATLRRITWANLILDEAQMIKNPQTRQSQAARALPAQHRIALTGTPIENKPEDLWSIIDFLNPGLMGHRKAFLLRTIDPSDLRHQVRPYILRRLKSDKSIIRDLPEKIISDLYCPLTSKQAKAYDAALHTFSHDLTSTTGLKRKGCILAILTRLKQICDHPLLPQITDPKEIPESILSVDSGKLLCLQDRLTEILANGESALIFTQYARMGALLRKRLEQTFTIDIPFLHGALSTKERSAQIATFTDNPLPGIFILSLRTGGLGLTLTKANHVIHFDRWWNPAVENQATDRAYRIGQTRNVIVHRMICRGTLEDRIDALLSEKQDLADSVITPTALTTLTGLSTEALTTFLHRTEDDTDVHPYI